MVTLETPNGRPAVSVVDVVKRGPDSPSKITYSQVLTPFLKKGLLQLEWVALETTVEARVCVHVKNRADFYKDFTAAIQPWAEKFVLPFRSQHWF